MLNGDIFFHAYAYDLDHINLGLPIYFKKSQQVTQYYRLPNTIHAVRIYVSRRRYRLMSASRVMGWEFCGVLEVSGAYTKCYTRDLSNLLWQRPAGRLPLDSMIRRGDMQMRFVVHVRTGVRYPSSLRSPEMNVTNISARFC